MRNIGRLFIKLIYFTLLILNEPVWSFEPITALIGVAVVGGLAGIYNYGKCKVFECCDKNYIAPNFTKLEKLLESRLYGQHIATQVVLAALEAHWKDDQPQKALTLSFHGLPGCGKNYITQFIKYIYFKKGKTSKYVHNFQARVHFPQEKNVEQYQASLQQWLKGNVSQCAYSMFIFDEVDKMPHSVLNAIKPMIDYNDFVDEVDYRKSVFIFLSNTGGSIIKEHLLNLWRNGKKRQDIDLHDFEKIISTGAFNEKGGFYRSDTIRSNLIDHYVPFFPMEREHVELCIKDQFLLRNVTPEPEHINEVLNYVEWGPPPENLYATTGCKRISQKVPLVIQKYQLRRSKHEDEL